MYKRQTFDSFSHWLEGVEGKLAEKKSSKFPISTVQSQLDEHYVSITCYNLDEHYVNIEVKTANRGTLCKHNMGTIQTELGTFSRDFAGDLIMLLLFHYRTRIKFSVVVLLSY